MCIYLEPKWHILEDSKHKIEGQSTPQKRDQLPLSQWVVATPTAWGIRKTVAGSAGKKRQVNGKETPWCCWTGKLYLAHFPTNKTYSHVDKCSQMFPWRFRSMFRSLGVSRILRSGVVEKWNRCLLDLWCLFVCTLILLHRLLPAKFSNFQYLYPAIYP